MGAGNGNCTFQVYNVREALVFYLFSGGTSNPTLIATSPTVAFADYSFPVRPRVLPGDTANDLKIAWTTTTVPASHTLKWGTTSGVYPNTVTATTATIAKSDLCGAPATTTGWMDLGVTATAVLFNIYATSINTVYYVLTDSRGVQSAEFVLQVPPPAGAVYPFYFASFGDLGRGSWDQGITWYVDACMHMCVFKCTRARLID
jgi:hypothetical protein